MERFGQPILYESVQTDVRAVLPCGCSIFVGQAMDNCTTTLVARPCMQPHTRIVQRAVGMLHENALPPEPEVVADLLTQAERQIRPPREESHT